MREKHSKIAEIECFWLFFAAKKQAYRVGVFFHHNLFVPPQGGGMEQSMSNYILIGMPGSGKTTLGQIVAKTLHRKFFDTDCLAADLIKQQHASVFSLFAYSRLFEQAQETVLVNLLENADNAIIATGAEIGLSDIAVVDLLHQIGTIIQIIRDPQTAFADSQQSKKGLVLRDFVSGEIMDFADRAFEQYVNTNEYDNAADFAVLNDGNEVDGAKKLSLLIEKLETPGVVLQEMALSERDIG